jgi:hypothetical protein
MLFPNPAVVALSTVPTVNCKNFIFVIPLFINRKYESLLRKYIK